MNRLPKVRDVLIVMLMVITGVFMAQAVQGAEGFGPEAQGMGGAGVASVNNHFAGSWNPANLSERGGFQGGWYANGGLETTRTFASDIEQAVQLFDDYSSVDYSDTQYYGDFLDASSEMNRILEGKNAGLVNVSSGMNFRWSHFGFGVNSYTEGTVFWEGSANQFLQLAVGDLSDTTVGNLLGQLGDTTVLSNFGDSAPTTAEFQDAKNAIQQDIQNALNPGDTVGALLSGCSDCAGLTADSVATELAYRAEQQQNEHDAITGDNLEEFSSNFMDDIVNMAYDSTASTSGTLGGPSAVSSDSPTIVAEGLMVNELTMSYGYPEPIFENSVGSLYVGANFKFMQGTVGSVACPFKNNQDCLNDVGDTNVERSTSFGLDIGFRYDMPDYGLKLALVGKNLNGPTFNYPDGSTVLPRNRGGEVTLEPTYRVGTEFRPLYLTSRQFGKDWWKMTMDYDLVPEQTMFSDYERQYLALGNEFNVVNRPVFNLALRAGLKDNVAEPASTRLYTLGAGLQFVRFNIDTSVLISDQRVEYNGNSIPTVLRVDLAASLQF